MRWSLRGGGPVVRLVVGAAALPLLLGGQCVQTRTVDMECPSSVRVGDQFSTRAGTSGFDFDFFSGAWTTEGAGALGACPLEFDARSCASSPTSRVTFSHLQVPSGWANMESMWWVALQEGLITIERTVREDNDTGGCDTTITAVDTVASCVIEVLPAAGDDDDSAGDDDDSAGDDDDASPPPPGWSIVGGFGDGLFPGAPSALAIAEVLYVSGIEEEFGGGDGERSGRSMAPLRVAPGWAPVAEQAEQGAFDDAFGPVLAPDGAGGLLLSRTYLNASGQARLAVDAQAPGATSLETLSSAVTTLGSLPRWKSVVTGPDGVPVLAWVEGSPDAYGYAQRLEQGASPIFVASPLDRLIALPTDPVVLVGQFRSAQGSDIVVYGPDEWSTWGFLGALSNAEAGWLEDELGAVVTPDGDVVVTFYELPPSASGEPAGMVCRRWTPGTDPATATDLGLTAAWGPITALAAGPAGELWFASLALDWSRVILWHFDPVADLWSQVPDPPASPSGDVDGFTIAADGVTEGVVSVVQSWRGPNGNGMQVLRYEVP